MCAPVTRRRSALLADATKWAVCAAAGVAAVVWRGRAANVLAGALANAAVAKVLKRVLNAPRPEGSRKTDAGMPSSHAASLFFLARAAGRASTPWGALALLLISALACAWRVRCGYHSIAQVGVGTVLGVSNEAMWHTFVLPALVAVGVPYAGGPMEMAAVGVVVIIVRDDALEA